VLLEKIQHHIPNDIDRNTKLDFFFGKNRHGMENDLVDMETNKEMKEIRD